ncbi:MAG: VWA domain-containing protein [Solirubrobacterales bacterium]
MPRRHLSTMLAVAGLLTAFYALAPAGAPAATCVPATNIEAIVDDSGSMDFTDRNVNRSEALKILIAKAGNAKKTLGALEFGSAGFSGGSPAATQLFAPGLIGANAAAMKTALDTNLKADHLGTDYNAAFALAGTENPNAAARIFLTDGGHNEGVYNNGHQGGPPTYVVGLGITDTPVNEASERLKAIAAETGGRYYPNVTTGNVNATMNEIDAALNCQSVAKTFTDKFTKQGQSVRRSSKIGAKSRSVDLLLSWEDPLNQFTIGSLKLDASRGRNPKLKITKQVGKTFLSVRVRGVKRGRLKFKLRAAKLGSLGLGQVTLTTQATQSRRR